MQAAPVPDTRPLLKYALSHKVVEEMQAAPVPDIKPFPKYPKVELQLSVLLIHLLALPSLK